MYQIGSRSSVSNIKLGNQILFFSGWGINKKGETKYFNDLWSFDLLSNKFTCLIDTQKYIYNDKTANYGFPGGRIGTTMFLHKNEVYLFGGKSNLNSEIVECNDLWKYNIATNKWKLLYNNDSSKKEGPSKMAYFYSWTIDNYLYIFNQLPNRSIEAWSLNLDNLQWIKIDRSFQTNPVFNKFTKIKNPKHFNINNLCYFIGGYSFETGELNNNVFVFDCKNLIWEERQLNLPYDFNRTSIPKVDNNTTSFVKNNQLYIITNGFNNKSQLVIIYFSLV